MNSHITTQRSAGPHITSQHGTSHQQLTHHITTHHMNNITSHRNSITHHMLFSPVVHAWQLLYSMLGTCCTLHAWHLPTCMTGIYRTVGLAPTVLHAWHLPCCTPGVHRNYASHYLQSFWLAWVRKARFFTHQMASHIDAPRSAVELRSILRSMHYLRRFGSLLLQRLAIYRLLARLGGEP